MNYVSVGGLSPANIQIGSIYFHYPVELPKPQHPKYFSAANLVSLEAIFQAFKQFN